MKNISLLIFFLAPLLIMGQRKSSYIHYYSKKDTFYTALNTPIYLHVSKNDDLNAPDTSWNYMVKPTLCNYLNNNPSTSKNGTQIIVNKDSILYTPPKDFIGEDNFYYGYCDSTETYIRDTNLVTVFIQLTTSFESFDKTTNIYPNPSTGYINVFTSYPADIFIYNQVGMIVDKFQKQEGNYAKFLDLENGFYFILIQDDMKIIQKHKLIISK